MRNLVTILILSCLLTHNLYAGCLEIFHRLKVRQAVTMQVLSEGEDSFMRRLDRIEQVGSWLRKLRKDKRPAIHAFMSKRMTKLDSYLSVGDYATAHRELRTLFRETEFSALAIKSINRQLEMVKSLGVKSLDEAREKLANSAVPAKHWLEQAFDKSRTLDGVFDELVYIRSRYEVKLGSKFQEYLLAREHLERLLAPGACSAECQSNITRLLDTLGVKYQSDRTRFASFLEVGDELSSDIMRDLIDGHRLAVTTRLKRERNAELFAVMSELATQPAIVQKILTGLTGIPGMHKLKIVRLFKTFLDSIAQTKHVPIINQIVRSQDDAATKLDQVLQHNGVFGGNEFLISFSRRSDLDTKRVWNEIISSANARDEALGNQLLQADQLGKARGPLDLLNSKTPLPRWLILAASGAGVGYFGFGKTDIDEIEFDDIEPIINGEIPLEGDEDQDLDEASEELSRLEVQEVILEAGERSPDSLAAQNLWERIRSWLSSLF